MESWDENNRVIYAGTRLGMRQSDGTDEWFTSWSPRNENGSALGPWCAWVDLARQILADDLTLQLMPDFHLSYDDRGHVAEHHSACQSPEGTAARARREKVAAEQRAEKEALFDQLKAELGR